MAVVIMVLDAREEFTLLLGIQCRVAFGRHSGFKRHVIVPVAYHRQWQDVRESAGINRSGVEMFKFSRIVVVVAVGAIVGVAMAKAIKIKAFDWVDAENPDGDGIAIANYHQGNNTTEINATITDFLPAQTT